MEGSGPAVCNDFGNKGGRGEMIKAPILRDLRQRIYVKEKAEPSGNTGGTVGRGGVGRGCYGLLE